MPNPYHFERRWLVIDERGVKVEGFMQYSPVLCGTVEDAKQLLRWSDRIQLSYEAPNADPR